MRGEADGVIMLRGPKPERAGADFLKDFDKGRNAGIVSGTGLIHRGRRTGLLTRQGYVPTRHYGFTRFGHQRVSVLAEKIGVGVGDSGEFPAGHGMAAEEERALFARKKLGGGLGDANFGAAGVGDERLRSSVARDFWKKIYGRGDGKRDVDQIGVLKGGSEVPGEGFVDCAASLRFTNDIGAVPAGDMRLGNVFAEREGEGAAD